MVFLLFKQHVLIVPLPQQLALLDAHQLDITLLIQLVSLAEPEPQFVLLPLMLHLVSLDIIYQDLFVFKLQLEQLLKDNLKLLLL